MSSGPIIFLLVLVSYASQETKVQRICFRLAPSYLAVVCLVRVQNWDIGRVENTHRANFIVFLQVYLPVSSLFRADINTHHLNERMTE
jgi:hypothetical protein